MRIHHLCAHRGYLCMIAHIYFSNIGLNEHRGCDLGGVGVILVVFLPVSHLMTRYKAKPSSYWIHSFFTNTFAGRAGHINAVSCAFTILAGFSTTFFQMLTPNPHFSVDFTHISNSHTTWAVMSTTYQSATGSPVIVPSLPTA